MKLLLFACLLLPALCQAQDSTTAAPINYARKSVWRALFLSPGVTNELRLGSKTTFVSSIQIGGGWYGTGSGSSSGGTNLYSSYYVNPVASVGVRHFYNFERRLERGKSIRYNSANYLMVKADYSFPSFLERIDFRSPLPTYQGPSLQALWGFQRTYRRNFYLNLALGLGVSTKRPDFAGDFSLGYTFPPTK